MGKLLGKTEEKLTKENAGISTYGEIRRMFLRLLNDGEAGPPEETGEESCRRSRQRELAKKPLKRLSEKVSRGMRENEQLESPAREVIGCGN